MLKKILILGSSGQIGQHLCSYLTEKKFTILRADVINSKNQDLRNQNNKIISRMIKQSDFVFFLAFDVGGSRYLKKYQNSSNFILNNISIMANTFALLKKEKKNFIFASSQMSNMDYSNYGILKKIGEKTTKSLKGLTVRFWNVYGVEKDFEKSHAITDFIINGIKYKKIKMLSNGKEERDFLYAEDACSGLELLMKNFSKFKKYEFIDLNYGKYYKIIDIAKIISNFFKQKGQVVKFFPSNTTDSVQLNKKNKSLENKLLKKYWRPKYSISRGIKEVFDYYFKKNSL
jgi:nucleoside-diphosphate-sugar epimerase